MSEGFLYVPDSGSQVRWMDGEPGFWNAVMGGIGRKSADLSSRRCTQCGFVEFFVDTQAKPVKTLKSIDEENERLRNLVTSLQDRLAVLETIATDPAERTAREIEALRALPSASDESDSA